MAFSADIVVPTQVAITPTVASPRRPGGAWVRMKRMKMVMSEPVAAWLARAACPIRSGLR